MRGGEDDLSGIANLDAGEGEGAEDDAPGREGGLRGSGKVGRIGGRVGENRT